MDLMTLQTILVLNWTYNVLGKIHFTYTGLYTLCVGSFYVLGDIRSRMRVYLRYTY